MVIVIRFLIELTLTILRENDVGALTKPLGSFGILEKQNLNFSKSSQTKQVKSSQVEESNKLFPTPFCFFSVGPLMFQSLPKRSDGTY